MINKVKSALIFNENEIINIGNISIKHVIDNFSIKNMQKSYFNFYQEVWFEKDSFNHRVGFCLLYVRLALSESYEKRFSKK